VGIARARVESIGIDVAVTRGLDIVGLDDSVRVAFGPATLRLIDLADLIRRTAPRVIAIDSPPAWGLSGKLRPIERQLQALGINIFPAPAAEFARDLHRWMEVGFDVFKVAGDLGYPLYTGGAHSAGRAIEVFPHASAVVLRGSLAPVGLAKSVWRRAVLEAAGLDCSEMRTTDHLDAALAAFTGLKFLGGISPLLALRERRCSFCRLVRCPPSDTSGTRLGPSAVSWVRTPHDDRSLTKRATHAAAAVARRPGVVTCQVTMRSTSRGFWPRCGQAVRLRSPSFNGSDGVGSRRSRKNPSLARLNRSRRSERNSVVTSDDLVLN
jgi:uncharacterized protein DUF429